MHILFKYLAAFTIALISLCLNACGGTSSSPGNGNNNGLYLGTLPNGSQVYSSSPQFTFPSRAESATGTISLVGGSPGYVYVLSFNPTTVKASALDVSAKSAIQGAESFPSGTLNGASQCTVTSGSSITSCVLAVFTNNAESGTYDLNPIATASNSNVTTLNPIPVVITGGKTPPVSKIIFITESSYLGNLESGGESTTPSIPGIPASSGVAGADAICQYEAYNDPGTLIPNGLTFKAMLVSSTRFPCDSNGVCGAQNANDWPVSANTNYVNPGAPSTVILTSDASGIFENSYTRNLILDPTGNIQSVNTWTGINGVLIGSTTGATGPIVGWSYANNSTSWGPVGNWSNYQVATCNDWTESGFSAAGWAGDNGYYPDLSFTTNGATPNAGYDTDSASGALIPPPDVPEATLSRWVAGFNNACSMRGTHIICLQQ